METLDLITGALRSIGILSEVATPSAEQGASALKNLNQLMASLAEDGIDFGYAPTTDPASDILLPLGHVGTIQALLAQIEASDYGVEIPPAVAGIAANGYTRMLGQAVAGQIQSARSSTLPAGDNQRYAWNIQTGEF